MSARREQELPPGWGRLRLERGVAGPVAGRPRSCASDGTRLSWLPGHAIAAGCSIACDIEHERRQPAPELFALVPAGSTFHRFWVLGELAAKLLNVPILILLQRHRRGVQPRFPRETSVIVGAGCWGSYTLACGALPDSARVHWSTGGELRDWGFPRIGEIVRRTAAAADRVHASPAGVSHGT